MQKRRIASVLFIVSLPGGMLVLSNGYELTMPYRILHTLIR